MNVIHTELDGVLILQPKVFGDARGYFFESWNRECMTEVGISVDFIQDNESCSIKGVLRGLHYQKSPYAQAKLVRVIRGRVRDVVVDIRKGSPTFGKHVAVELSGDNKKMLFVPRGFAHGFVSLDEGTIFAYKCDNKYASSHERGISPFDPGLGIDWGITKDAVIMSEKDACAPLLANADFDDFFSLTEH